MMHIEFTLSPADWAAFGEFQARHLATVRRQIRRAQVVSATAVVLLAVAVAVLVDPWGIAIVALGAGMIVVWDIPRQIRANVRRQMAALFDEGRNPCVRGRHRLEALAEGLAARCDASQSLTAWSAIEDVAQTPSHAFLLLGGGRGLIIPRERIVEGSLDSFLARVRELSGSVAPADGVGITRARQ
jgi:hypothetical protein